MHPPAAGCSPLPLVSCTPGCWAPSQRIKGVDPPASPILPPRSLCFPHEIRPKKKKKKTRPLDSNFSCLRLAIVQFFVCCRFDSSVRPLRDAAHTSRWSTGKRGTTPLALPRRQSAVGFFPLCHHAELLNTHHGLVSAPPRFAGHGSRHGFRCSRQDFTQSTLPLFRRLLPDAAPDILVLRHRHPPSANVEPRLLPTSANILLSCRRQICLRSLLPCSSGRLPDHLATVSPSTLGRHNPGVYQHLVSNTPIRLRGALLAVDASTSIDRSGGIHPRQMVAGPPNEPSVQLLHNGLRSQDFSGLAGSPVGAGHLIPPKPNRWCHGTVL